MTEIRVGVKFTSEASEFESTFQKPVETALSEFQKFVSGINSQTLETVSGLNEGIKQLASNASDFISPQANAAAGRSSTFPSTSQNEETVVRLNTSDLERAIESLCDCFRQNSLSPNVLSEAERAIITGIVTGLGTAVGFTLGSVGGPIGQAIGASVGTVAGAFIANHIIEAVEESNRAGAARRKELLQGTIEVPDEERVMRVILAPDLPQEELDKLPPITRELLLLPNLTQILDALPPDLLNELDKDVISPETERRIRDFIKDFNTNNQDLIDGVQNGQEELSKYGEDFDILDGAIAMAGDGLVAGAGAQDKFLISTQTTAEELEKEVEQINNLDSNTQNLVAQNQNLTNSQNNVTDAVKEGGQEMINTAEGAEELAEQSGTASKALDSLGVFASNVATQISETFSDFLFEAFKGNFDSIDDLFDDLLDTMLRSFTDFAAAIITNPIRVTLEGTLSGKAGGGGIGGLFSGIGDLLGPVGDLFKSGGPLASIGDFFGDLFAEGGPLGFIGQIGNFLGPIGSAVSAVASIAIPLIGGLLKKTPRLDLDFDTFRNEAGKSLGIAAEVADFLDSEVFNNEIFNRSVSRQAGLGLGSELPNVIREAIEGQIRSIQDIINRLPSDLASSLNDALLNTAVDIESEVKGDRLLEFDETKDIQEKFEQFINGDLQARFVFAIREFFTGAFEALGALPDAARAFVEGEFETFQGLNREQRAEFGANFVEEFGAVVNEHVNDVRFAVSKVKEKVDDLHDWHNKTDEDGVFNWYVKRSLEDVIKDLGSKIELQIGVQTKILQHMQKMEELYRKKIEKGEE